MPVIEPDPTTLNNFILGRAAMNAASRELGSMIRAITDVMDERQRQIEAEGFTREHDDKNSGHNLTRAAAAYALNGPYPSDDPPWFWPWDGKWWKPKYERRDLVRAAALIIARIEQIDRKGAPKPCGMSVYPGRLSQAKRHGFTSLLFLILVNDLLTAAAIAFAFWKGWIGS